jgi:hypothetical protein
VSYATWVVVLYSTSYTATIPGVMDEFAVSSRPVATLGLTTYLLGLAAGSVVVAPMSGMLSLSLSLSLSLCVCVCVAGWWGGYGVIRVFLFGCLVWGGCEPVFAHFVSGLFIPAFGGRGRAYDPPVSRKR